VTRVLGFAFGAVLFAMAAALAMVAPDVLARSLELEPFHGRVAFLAYAVATLGGAAMGAGIMGAAILARRG
jgi:hypothetical protein